MHGCIIPSVCENVKPSLSEDLGNRHNLGRSPLRLADWRRRQGRSGNESRCISWVYYNRCLGECQALVPKKVQE